MQPKPPSRVASTAAVALALATAAGAVAHAAPGSLDDGASWKFRSDHSGRCLDVGEAATIDGARLEQRNCHGEGNQRFVLERQGNGSHRVVATHSGQCLTVPAQGVGNGGIVVQSPCEFAAPGGRNEFVFEARQDNRYRIRLNGTDKCLDAGGSADVLLWSCYEGAAQRWAPFRS